jgi:hypothetical protein
MTFPVRHHPIGFFGMLGWKSNPSSPESTLAVMIDVTFEAVPTPALALNFSI